MIANLLVRQDWGWRSLLNYQLFQKLNLIKNDEFNNLINIITSPFSVSTPYICYAIVELAHWLP
jgi:hypothetical protein